MTMVQALADFVVKASYDMLSDAAREQLKIRVLDSLGCALGALEGEPIRMIRENIAGSGETGKCTLIGGGNAAPDRAALYNGALVRYLDFNDSYLARYETCHPSDNLGPLLAAAEYAGRGGRDLMTALAVAYQAQCRLSDVAPVRAAGFDHTAQGAYSAPAGVSRLLGLDRDATANAIAICGTAFNALRVTRTGKLSHWKGLAFPHMGACCTNVTFLAGHGITGPLEVFEGEKGLMDAITGPFEIDWSMEGLERVTRTILKRYNAEIHSQTAIDGVLQLKAEFHFDPADIAGIDLEVFDVAYNIIGGGEEGDKTVLIDTKERADHSLPYIVAVAILDGEVMPAQYSAERISRADVQQLLHKVSVRPNARYSERFPNEMPCRITLSLRGGRVLTREIRDYPGFVTNPMSWETALGKFEALAAPRVPVSQRRRIAAAVADLDRISIGELMQLLGNAGLEQE